MIKLLYKPVSMLVSLAGGILARTIFKKAWRLAAGQDDVPSATDAGRAWPEVLIAAALQGAIFAVVSATVDRLAAHGTRSLTGTWPGEDSSAETEEKAQS